MVDHSAVAIVCKREGGRSRRKYIHENELNGETVIGHVPKLMAPWLTKFLKRPTKKGRAVVKGKRVNRGAGYGLEIPCEYCFTGDEFSIQWLRVSASNKDRAKMEIEPKIKILKLCQNKAYHTPD